VVSPTRVPEWRKWSGCCDRGGSLLLADHVGSTNPFIRLGQWALQTITILAEGEHWTRRPRRYVEALGVPVVETGRLHHGIIERLHASRRVR